MEFPLTDLQVRDEPTFQRDGSVVAMKRASFYLGSHGPFYERVPADDQFDSELRRRIDRLRAQLENLTR